MPDPQSNQSTDPLRIIGPQSSKKIARKGFSAIFLIFLSFIVSTAGVLAARGNGIPPAIYFILMLVVFPLLADGMARFFQKRRLAELAILLLCALACTAVAWRSSRIAPQVAFSHIFNTSPPALASNMESRRQWFDGRIWLLRFDLPEEDFQSLVASTGLDAVELDGATTQWLQTLWQFDIQQWSAIAYDYWPQASPVGDIEIYHGANEGMSTGGDVIATHIFRDKVTGRTWVVRLD